MRLYDEPFSLTHPEIAAEWSKKNFPYTPEDATAGCHDRVWWKGKCGHEWQSQINNRCLNNTGCPYCSNHKVLKGFNDLPTVKPELISEWSERNGDLKPDDFGPFSRKKVWWKCKNGHEWQATINSRSSGNGCRKCSNKVVQKGFNDLATKRPDIAKEWSKKNHPLTPESVMWKKHASFWWKCSVCGNEYKAWLSQRIERNQGCPYCSGYKVIAGFNDLKTTDPDIAKDWDYIGNGDLVPQDFFRTSMRFVKWNCSNGHTYGMKISDRTLNGKGCIKCDMTFRAAFPEMLILLIAKREGLRREIRTDVAEIYLPELNLAFDAEGVSYERRKEQRKKRTRLKNKGIKLFVLPRADDLHESAESVVDMFNDVGIKVNDCVEDDIEVLKREFYRKDYRKEPYSGGGKFKDVPGAVRNYSKEKTKPLNKTHPELCKEWSEKNFPFKPEDEHMKSCDKVWWKCPKCGSEWSSMVRNRTFNAHGCPVCVGKKVVPGINDLRTTHPELCEEWSPKNKSIRPEQFSQGSSRKVWWRCKHGHEWQTSISNRVRGNGCPICAKNTGSLDKTDLLADHPEILNMWSERNGNLKPQDIPSVYNKKIWWKCQVCGNEFRAQLKTVLKRARPGCNRCQSQVGRGWKCLVQEDEFIKEEYR